MIRIKASNQSGQVLLMLILISSLLLTVGLSMTQIGVNETKISKMEEESKKAFQAAEAGIEKTLDMMKTAPNTTEFSIPSADFNQVGVSTKVTNSSAANPTKFKTPVVRKDEQFTFYLSKYDPVSGNWSNPYGGTLKFYLNSPKTCADPNSTPAIELTYIFGNSPYDSEKWIIDPCDRFSGGNVLASNSYGAGDSYFADFKTITNPMTIDIAKNPKIIIARVLYADATIGFEGSSSLNDQGKYITSTANSSTNVTKKVELFQSLPQIPADFFVTSF